MLVVDAHGHLDAGAWGDVLTVAAQYHGLAELVTNGSVRDSRAIIAMSFPVFAKGLSIVGTSKTFDCTIGNPVTIDGVRVATGDILVRDVTKWSWSGPGALGPRSLPPRRGTKTRPVCEK